MKFNAGLCGVLKNLDILDEESIPKSRFLHSRRKRRSSCLLGSEF